MFVDIEVIDEKETEENKKINLTLSESKFNREKLENNEAEKNLDFEGLFFEEKVKRENKGNKGKGGPEEASKGNGYIGKRNH